jgi:hypothetical protein
MSEILSGAATGDKKNVGNRESNLYKIMQIVHRYLRHFERRVEGNGTVPMGKRVISDDMNAFDNSLRMGEEPL